MVRYAIALFALLFIPLSYGGGIDYSAVKNSVISHCQKEPSDKLKMSCLVQSSSYIPVFEKAFESKEKELLTICANLTLSLRDNEVRMFHLVRCVAEQYDMEQRHPHPQYARLMLRKSELRGYWASTCPNKNDIGQCLKSHDMGFSAFWRYYVAASSKSKGDPVFSRIDGCVNQQDIRLTDFTKINTCIGY
jgi:hypothetical protein